VSRVRSLCSWMKVASAKKDLCLVLTAGSWRSRRVVQQKGAANKMDNPNQQSRVNGAKDCKECQADEMTSSSVLEKCALTASGCLSMSAQHQRNLVVT